MWVLYASLLAVLAGINPCFERIEGYSKKCWTTWLRTSSGPIPFLFSIAYFYFWTPSMAGPFWGGPFWGMATFLLTYWGVTGPLLCIGGIIGKDEGGSENIGYWHAVLMRGVHTLVLFLALLVIASIRAWFGGPF